MIELLPCGHFNKRIIIPKIINKADETSSYFRPLSPDKYFCHSYFNPKKVESSKDFKFFNEDTLNNTERSVV